MKEKSEDPPFLFYETWKIVYTKPQNEFCAQDNLLDQGFEVNLLTLFVEKFAKAKSSEMLNPYFCAIVLCDNWSK